MAPAPQHLHHIQLHLHKECSYDSASTRTHTALRSTPQPLHGGDPFEAFFVPFVRKLASPCPPEYPTFSISETV